MKTYYTRAPVKATSVWWPCTPGIFYSPLTFEVREFDHPPQRGEGFVPEATASSDSVIEAVVEKLRSRSKVGVDKYGTTLADNNGSPLYWLNHIQEELMDAINYIERVKSSLEKSA